MSKDQKNSHDESPDEANSEGSEESCSGRMEQRSVHLRPRDIKEIWRVLRTRPLYRSFSHVLRVHLTRSLLPRIEKGNVSLRKFARRVTGRKMSPPGRERTQVSLEDWTPVVKAAQTMDEALRRLEEKMAWEGSIRVFPSCQIRATLVVRAAAQEIAIATRGGLAEFFSQEGDMETSWKLPKTIASGGVFGEKPARAKSSGGLSGPEASPEVTSGDPGHQLLEKSPGRDRGGEQLHLAITEEAASMLKHKAEKESLFASDLARFAVWKIVQWIEEDPGEAFEYIRKERSFYEMEREGGYEGYQFYIDPEMKREVSSARKTLEEGPGEDLDRRFTQREVLQGAARYAIETEGLCPPLPGEDSS